MSLCVPWGRSPSGSVSPPKLHSTRPDKRMAPLHTVTKRDRPPCPPTVTRKALALTYSAPIEPPGNLTPDALDVFEDVVSERGDKMTPEAFAALVQACRLISLADRAEDAIGDAWIIQGYRGQPVANPLLGEARMARASAVQALKVVGIVPGSTSASRAGAALAGARWRRS
ncbi:hypothetical protein SAMN06264365_103413 [Actinoplanes regularis]|uniref:Uncharacterized protein n=1 Tax=Actinoplanes regularis TaxID=52697 RepID=A0A238XH29_9ACTN|nr:hypothetical protein SAMN06264365_103413 [Actinoplanes regularis]